MLLLKVTIGHVVELVIHLVKVPELEPEDDTRDEGQHGHGAVVPHEQRILRERDKRLAEGGRDGGSEEVERHDERTHVLRCLGERVLETGDGCEDLGEGDEDVTASLDPDVQRADDGVLVGVHT